MQTKDSLKTYKIMEKGEAGACLALAEAHGLASVAFCCISTGEFHFPNDLAAQIAVDTVSAWQRDHPQAPAVVFNVFKDEDRALYEALLR